MSDTSETDVKATLQNLKVALEEVSKLARTLKEERDEARDASEAFSALAWKLEGERNEAREQTERCLAILKKHNLDQHGN